MRVYTKGLPPRTANSALDGDAAPRPKLLPRPSIDTWRAVAFEDFDWYLVLTKPGAETTACWQLQNQAFRPWLPICRYETKSGRQVSEKLSPLWPRYVFAGVAPGADAVPIASTIGVSDVVRTEGGRWFALPKPVLELVEELLRKHGGVYHAPRREAVVLHPGDPLTITSGPFAGFKGPCVVSSDARTTLWLDIMGSSRQITVPTEHVSAG